MRTAQGTAIACAWAAASLTSKMGQLVREAEQRRAERRTEDQEILKGIHAHLGKLDSSLAHLC